MNVEEKVPSVRISVWDYQRRDSDVPLWRGEAIPDELVYYLLGVLESHVRGAIGRFRGGATVSFDILLTIGEEDLPF